MYVRDKPSPPNVRFCNEKKKEKWMTSLVYPILEGIPVISLSFVFETPTADS